MPANKLKQQSNPIGADGAHDDTARPTVSRSFVRGPRTALIATIAIGLLVVVIAVGGVLWWRAHNRALANTAAANKAAQSVLQKKLAFDLSRGANQLIVDDTHALISGKSAGEFTFSNQLLAQYYMYAGAAYTNLKEYSQALAAYKAAPQYSSNETQAALQGQLYAGYRSGERQQLIPILQQLVTLSKQHPDPFGTSAGHYEADIQALENNQELSL